jgi:hypothetical protein
LKNIHDDTSEWHSKKLFTKFLHTILNFVEWKKVHRWEFIFKCTYKLIWVRFYWPFHA